MKIRTAWVLLAVLPLLLMGATAARSDVNFSQYLFDEPMTLMAWVQEVNQSTGYVVVSGVDMSGPPVPFVWNWGDGNTSSSWFPGTHTYADTTRNYVCTVRADYAPGDSDSVQMVIRFAAPDVTPVALPDETRVCIPDTLVPLTSRMPGYGIPDFEPFGDEVFAVMPRWVVEYALSVGAGIQNEMVNGDVFLVDGGFRQYIFRDADFPGMYSLWFTSPVSFGAGDYAFGQTIQWSSFLHEMGHNATLNMPADYYYGGKIDGCANCIYSETMAQIFQYATAHEMMNNGAAYGLPDDLLMDIWTSSISAISGLRNAYDQYVDDGMNFCCWNDPGTPEDDTIYTFATLAYKFCAHAETSRAGYYEPLRRMTELLAVFDEDLRTRYDQHNNNAAADTFRSTLMVTAISYGFDTDLRSEFAALNFPISDATYDELLDMVTSVPDEGPGTDGVDAAGLALSCRPNPCHLRTVVSYELPSTGTVAVRIYDLRGRVVRTLFDGERSAGLHVATWDGRDDSGRGVASGVYFLKVLSGAAEATGKIVLLQ